jgi:hypothetical protein
MKQIKIIIEKSANHYCAFAENIEGIYGSGSSVLEAKNSIIESIKLFKKYNKTRIPKILQQEYELIYKFDTQSFLNYYKGIFTNASLERITGIKQKQIQHYASGLKKPRLAQKQKIQNSLKELAEELLTFEL